MAKWYNWNKFYIGVTFGFSSLNIISFIVSYFVPWFRFVIVDFNWNFLELGDNSVTCDKM